MSRLIVKGIPKEITEEQLKKHLSVKGEITDVKIMKKPNGESRKFAFVGFKSEEQGLNAIKYFNNTYIKTCRIQIEEAKLQGDPSLNKGFTKKKNAKIVESDVNSASATKESKINKLLELAKQFSNKSKFDAAEKKLLMNEENNSNTNADGVAKINEMDSKNKEKNETNTYQDSTGLENKINSEKLDPKRLYLRNIPFDISEEDLRTKFEKYGDITELHIPKNYQTNKSFGYAYIAYATVESSIMALSEMDKTYFQGRTLHITPAQIKEEKYKPPVIENTPKENVSNFKKEKKEKMRSNFESETNWNYLFMNQDAVIEAVSRKLNIPKNEIMSKDNANLAVQVAAMETTIINETKDWLVTQGINLDSLKGKRADCSRSKTIILIKNISTKMNKEKLEEYFSRYGLLIRFALSPNNTMAIAEFVDKKHAENCMKKLAYFEIEGLPLYLEYAPEGIIKSKGATEDKTNVKSEKEEKYKNSKNEIDLKESQGKVVFVTNLNFITKENILKKFFDSQGYQTTNVKIIMHKKEGDDKQLSSGYGFIEFQTEEVALNAIKKLQGVLLEGHSLKLSIAKTTLKDKDNKDEAMLQNKRKRETDLNDYEFEGDEVTNNKILVRNLAFEANKDELRQLFKAFGEVKTIRVPNKLDGTHRGFAFIEFVSHDEAKAAFKSLQNTHFYGRKLVLEWAQREKTVDELRKDTERKVKASMIRTHRTQNKANVNLNYIK
jgi:multiple RNA-binding domain-containing protein 1